MGLIDIKLKGKHTLKCLKFIVYKVVLPILGLFFYLIIFQTEKLKTILQIVFNPITGSG